MDSYQASGQLEGAITLFETCVSAFPSSESAKSHLLEARKLHQAAKQYEGELLSMANSLEAGRLEPARKSLVAAKTSRFADERLPPLEKTLIAKEKEAAFRTALKGAEKHLDRGELAEGLARLAESLNESPENQVAKAWQEAAKLAQEIMSKHTSIHQTMRAGNLDSAGTMRRETGNQVISGQEQSAWKSGPLASTVKSIVAEQIAIGRNLIDALDTSCQTESAASMTAWADRKFKESLARLNRGRAGLLSALEHCKEMQRFQADEAMSEMLRFQKRLDELDHTSKEIRATALLYEGMESLAQAESVLGKARANPERVPEGVEQAERAIGHLAEATRQGSKHAEELAAKALRTKQSLIRLRQPLQFDASSTSAGEFSFSAKQWKTRKDLAGNAVLHASAASATFSSSQEPWPDDFELQAEFAVLDETGTPKNLLFNFYDQPFTLLLRGEQGKADSIRFSLGRDKGNGTVPIWGLRVQSKVYSLKRVETEQSVTLRVVRKGNTLTAFVNGVQAMESTVTARFEGLTVETTSLFHPALERRDGSIGLYRIRVRALGFKGN